MKALIGLLALPLFAQQTIDSYSVAKEQALEKQYAAEIRRQSQPLDNPVADAYVKRIGSELVSHLQGTPSVYNFEVIVTDAAEPIPLPGGYIFIPATLFLSAQNEAEFAGILAHSIGHIALRHGIRAGKIANTAAIPLIFMDSPADSQRSTLLPIGVQRLQRTYELEAEKFGVELTGRAGYNTASSTDEFLRAQEAVRQALPQPKPHRAPTLRR